MAMLDLTKATAFVDMTDPDLVTYKSAGGLPLSFYYNFGTQADSSVVLRGENFAFGPDGRPTAGNVTKIEFDTGQYDAYRPEITITGINVDPATMDDGPDSFWRILEGNDVIIGPSQATVHPGTEFRLIGDGIAGRNGITGGTDIIQPGDAQVTAFGDVGHVGGRTAGSPSIDYRGGNDDFTGHATTEFQTFVGDAEVVLATGRLTGGNDTFYIQSTSAHSIAAGDAVLVEGRAGDVAEVLGGNDYLKAGIDFHGRLVGDARALLAFAVVRGGSDTIEGGGVRDEIYGDVEDILGGRTFGAADRLSGNDGNDFIAGDAGRVEQGTRLFGGNDLIYGGAGNDLIYGEAASRSGGTVSGGDDMIFGEAGKDEIFGQTGNDQLYGGADADTLRGASGNDFLDGGSGADTMQGAAGNDIYVVDSANDQTIEQPGGGVDMVLSYLGSITLADNLEKLTSFATGNFIGIGNALANVIGTGGGEDAIGGRAGDDRLIAGSGRDQLHGEEGNDVLDGGSGGDRMEGGQGSDTVSYASAGEGVTMSLDRSLTATGDALGDSLLDIEALTGSAFSDVLRGDSGANRLSGGGGTDILQGQGGNDVIVGGAGDDTFSGGAGNDAFVFTGLRDGRDRIEDFGNSARNNDTLRFDGDVFGDLADGALAAGRFVANAAGAATTLAQRFLYETDTGILRYDANGSAAGGSVVIVTLAGAPTLGLSDFSII